MIRPPTEAEMVLLDAIEEHSGAQAAAHVQAAIEGRESVLGALLLDHAAELAGPLGAELEAARTAESDSRK